MHEVNLFYDKMISPLIIIIIHTCIFKDIKTELEKARKEIDDERKAHDLTKKDLEYARLKMDAKARKEIDDERKAHELTKKDLEYARLEIKMEKSEKNAQIKALKDELSSIKVSEG